MMPSKLDMLDFVNEMRSLATPETRARRIDACRSAIDLAERRGDTKLLGFLKLALGLSLDNKGDPVDNIEDAIAAYSSSLDCWRHEDPTRWAKIHGWLGNLYSRRREGNADENSNAALSHYESTLEVFVPTNFPLDYADGHHLIGLQYMRRILARSGCDAESLIDYSFRTHPVHVRAQIESDARAAAGHLVQALRVFQRAKCPDSCAVVRSDLGLAHLVRNHDRDPTIAIRHLRKALHAPALQKMPKEWTDASSRLRRALQMAGKQQ